MPELTTQGIDVTKEEQRYLRRTFHRIAWPYAVVLMAFAWWLSSGSTAGADPSEELAALRAELTEVGRSMDALSKGLAKVDRRASSAAELAGNLQAGQDRDPDAVASLERDLKRVSGRIASLEQKLGTALEQRFHALTDRIARVENQARPNGAVPGSPAPSPDSPDSPDSP